MPRSVKDLRQFTAAIHVFFSIILASALDQLSIASTNLADAHNAQHFWDFYSSQKKRITITLSVARAPVQNGRIKNVLFVTKSIYYKCCFWGVFRVIACDFQYKTAPFFVVQASISFLLCHLIKNLRHLPPTTTRIQVNIFRLTNAITKWDL